MAITATTAAALTAAAAVVAAGSSVAAGVAAKGQADAQAEVAEQQAEAERIRAQERKRDFQKRQDRLRASVRAAGGARGIEVGTGSPLLADLDFSKETELQAERIRRGGELSATRLEQRAGFLQSQGRTALAAGGIEAGGSLLRGAGRTARILSDVRQPATN